MAVLPLRLFPNNPNLNFLGLRKCAYFLSITITVLTIFLLFYKGLNLGIDFSGGLVIELKTTAANEVQTFRNKLSTHGYHGAIIQNYGNDEIMIRLQPKTDISQAQEVNDIKEIITEYIDPHVEVRKVDFVGPKVGKELVFSGFIALAVALVSMLGYIWFRFDWQFGTGAIISLLHDAIATLGFYLVSGYEFDLSSIAAILLIIGYSINDTVVIYDRIRENLRKYKTKTLQELINLSVNETLSRTVMTVATTLLVCLSLVLVGGEANKGFSMAMFFGIAFGTYSSIFVAAPILMMTGLKVRQ